MVRRASDLGSSGEQDPAEVTLDTLAGQPLWVAWREEPREEGGKPTKIPYDPWGNKAAVDNPRSWETRRQAELRAKMLRPKGYEGNGGIGVVLGVDIGCDQYIVGIDLDTCVAADGRIETWAAEVIERFASYAEISPSQTGAKVFGVMKGADLTMVRAMLGGQAGRVWAWPGHKHPPGIAFYSGGRYFTTTGCQITDRPADLRRIDVAAVEWLVKEAAPAFLASGPAGGEAKRNAGRDNSRSTMAFRLAGAMQRAGHSYEDFAAAVRTSDDTGLAGWYAETGRKPGLHNGEWVDERELHRAWDNAAGDVFERNDRGAIVPNSQTNIRLGLAKLGVRVAHDVFADRTLVDGPDDKPRRHLGDPELERLYLLIDARFGFRPTIDFFRMVVQDEARRNSFHPIRDYLAALHWDGKPRLERWLAAYAGAEDSEYVRAVGKLVLVAAVRRVREPGCKFDEMLVLESAQGLDKSSALAVLAVNEEWFTDALPLGADDKKVIETLAGRWIVEAAELQGMRKGDVEHLKAFLSRRIDRARPAYGRLPIEAPRQCVIIGTTNSERYLRDSTGNRRYWPVKVGRFDIDALRRDRDQLWAEAAAVEAKGESIRLDPRLYPDAGKEQEARTVKDPWIEVIGDALGDRYGKIKTEGIWTIVNVPVERRTPNDETRLGEAMRALGWKHDQRRFDGKRKWGYLRADPEGGDPEGKHLPVIYVNRDLDGEVNVIVGKPEIETEKDPLSATIRKAKAAR